MKALATFIIESTNNLEVKFKSPRDAAYGTVSFESEYDKDGNELNIMNVTVKRKGLPTGKKEIGTFNIDDKWTAKKKKEKAKEIYLNWLNNNPVASKSASSEMGEILTHLSDNGLKPRDNGAFVQDQKLIHRGMGSMKNYFNTVGEVAAFIEDNFDVEEIKRGSNKGVKVSLDGKFLFHLSMKGNRILMSFSGEDKLFNSAEELFYHIGVACHSGEYDKINNNLMAWSAGKNWAGTEW